MDSSIPPDDHTRKTVTFTHKQLGWGGGTMAALALVAQLKGGFLTREEGAAQGKDIVELKLYQDRNFDDMKIASAKQFDEVKHMIFDAQTELGHRIERSNDKLVERVKDAEARMATRAETQDHRIDTLEQAVIVSRSKTKNN